MKRLTCTASILLLVLASFSVARADGPVLIDAKTKVSLQLLSPISTATSKKGDKFTCKVLTPAEFAGAIVEGHVRSVKRSGKADKESKIDLAFDRVTLADGRMANFSATVTEVFDVVSAKDQGLADNEGTIRNKSSTVKTSMKRAAVGALIGALVGGAVAGGQGAIVGAAIGASVGVTTTLAQRGADLEFKTGTEFTVELDSPSRVTRGPSTPTPTASSGGASAPPNIKPLTTGGHETGSATIVVPVPSLRSRLYVTPWFRTNIPDNWREFSTSPSMVGPDGAFRLNNGRSELTHGMMLGAAAVQSKNLPQISEQLIATVLKGNPHLQRQGNSTNASIGGRPAVVNVLSGVWSDGKTEIVTVYTLLLPNGQFLYMTAVTPESDAAQYREAFNKILAGIAFNN